VVLSLVAPHIVPTLYGANFVETGRLLAIMALAIPFIMVNALLLNRVIALGQSRVFLGVYSGTAVAAIVLDISLLHLYGLAGLAAAIVVREVLMFAAFQALSRRELQSGRIAAQYLEESVK
jgi:O-antigen/teichoic acid export membrane protein